MSEQEKKRLNKEGNVCLGLGLGLGALGVTVAACPLCYVATPLLVGAGIVQKSRAYFNQPSKEPAAKSSDPYAEYLSRAHTLADKIQVVHTEIPTTKIPDEGYFIRNTSGRLELWSTERGEEAPIVGGTVDDLLYEVFEAITFRRAVQYERTHRIESADCRRAIWKYQSDLMRTLNKDWLTDLEDDIRCTLIQNPYSDESSPTNNSSYIHSPTEIIQIVESEINKLRSSSLNSVGSARIAVLEAVNQFLSRSSFPTTLEDKQRLSLIPYYFQEANYDDISWTDKSADLGHLQSIFEVDFALKHAGLKRSAASKRLFNRYVWRHLLRKTT